MISTSPATERRLQIVPLSTAWITDELLRETRRVWSRTYRRPVDDCEATEILMNVKRLTEVLMKTAKTENTP